MLRNKKKIFGVIHEFSYEESTTYQGYEPITQCYGVCFTKDGLVVIGRPKHLKNYMLPGGTPEENETPEETLIREVDEEVSCKILKHQLLGVQKVSFPNNEYTTRYQLRYACIVEQQALTPDPDFNEEWEILLVKPEEVNKYLKWGVILDRIMEQALEWFYQQKKN